MRTSFFFSAAGAVVRSVEKTVLELRCCLTVFDRDVLALDSAYVGQETMEHRRTRIASEARLAFRYPVTGSSGCRARRSAKTPPNH